MDIDASRYIYYGFLRGLTPDTTYYFTVGNGDTISGDTFIDEKKFRTAPSSGDFNFITGGDIGTNPAAPTLMKAAAATEPLYMAIGGDLAYANGIRACYPRWDAFLTNLEENAVTPTGYTVPFIMAPGNHEAAGWAQPAKNMRFYNRYFVHENLQGRLAKDLPLHHVHYISNQVLVALDSNVIETPESQVAWLAEKLSTAPAGSFKTAMYHAPGYPSVRPLNDHESTGVRTHFVPVFEQYGLTAGFENHDHAYKRTKLLLNSQEAPNGILYIGDGAMGVKARPGVSTAGRDYLQTAFSKQFFIVARTNNTGSSIEFTAYDLDNIAFDSFVMNYRN
jgi:3',5'-cyclic AMP phosphodiesterase CpdA